MAIYFISDLHLNVIDETTTLLFEKFLNTIAPNAQALYILGDLFEVWVGDDYQSAFNKKIIQALSKYSQSVPTYIMHGNRDFLLGQRFCKETGCQFIEDPIAIDLYGTPTLLAHGDALCTDDKNYQQFRLKARAPLFQQKLLAKPLWVRRLLAWYYRAKSKRYTQNASVKIMDTNKDELLKVMEHYQVHQLIHGHTHRPSLHLYLGHAKKEIIVLSDWTTQGNYLVYFPDGKKYLQYFE